MTQLRMILAAGLLVAGQAQAWEEPARGSATRAALMDAIRPHAEWALGGPVEFIVQELRRDGDVAFSSLEAQRPGGGAIDTATTPIVQRQEAEDWMDLEQVLVLYKKSGDTWVAVHFSFGATDAWFVWEPLCREYRPVISDYCNGVD